LNPCLPSIDHEAFFRTREVEDKEDDWPEDDVSESDPSSSLLSSPEEAPVSKVLGFCKLQSLSEF